jgi:putative Mg2+ transporter-C (MgtC) family protein
MNLTFTSLDYSLLLDATLRLGLAFLLALPIARERETHDVSAGLRTFPIVAVGACALILLSRAVLGPKSDSQTHVLQGLVTGVGFIGGGAIIKANDRVHGTATAACIWATAVIGASVGFGQSEIALVLAFTTFVTLRVVCRIEERNKLQPTEAVTLEHVERLRTDS